jgi:pyruvate,water dikinase
MKARRDATAVREVFRNQANRQGDVMKSKYTLDFFEIRNEDVALVGGKNASLGELFSALKPKGVGVLDGFALTTDAYWRLLEEQGLRAKL